MSQIKDSQTQSMRTLSNEIKLTSLPHDVLCTIIEHVALPLGKVVHLQDFPEDALSIAASSEQLASCVRDVYHNSVLGINDIAPFEMHQVNNVFTYSNQRYSPSCYARVIPRTLLEIKLPANAEPKFVSTFLSGILPRCNHMRKLCFRDSGELSNSGLRALRKLNLRVIEVVTPSNPILQIVVSNRFRNIQCISLLSLNASQFSTAAHALYSRFEEGSLSRLLSLSLSVDSTNITSSSSGHAMFKRACHFLGVSFVHKTLVLTNHMEKFTLTISHLAMPVPKAFVVLREALTQHKRHQAVKLIHLRWGTNASRILERASEPSNLRHTPATRTMITIESSGRFMATPGRLLLLSCSPHLTYSLETRRVYVERDTPTYRNCFRVQRSTSGGRQFCFLPSLLPHEVFREKNKAFYIHLYICVVITAVKHLRVVQIPYDALVAMHCTGIVNCKNDVWRKTEVLHLTGMPSTSPRRVRNVQGRSLLALLVVALSSLLGSATPPMSLTIFMDEDLDWANEEEIAESLNEDEIRTLEEKIALHPEGDFTSVKLFISKLRKLLHE